MEPVTSFLPYTSKIELVRIDRMYEYKNLTFLCVRADMNRFDKKRETLRRRKLRVFHSIRSKTARYRLIFVRSNQYISSQIIDDVSSKTLCSASTNEKSFADSKALKNKEAAKSLGVLIAKRAVEKGIKKVVLDRRGRLYHGRIVEFSEGARSQGLEF